ncbi:MAG: hypothetical protein JWN74_910 [Acidobacteriaceae bacterium]|nr:hypothetical protein [Acidobacteriaceae bacterium]
MKNARPKPLSARTATAVKWAAFLIFGSAVFAQAALAKAVGTVKSISANSVVLTTDSGAEVTVLINDSTRILQATPGQTDLKSAAPIQASDIRVGDRVLALGPSGEGNSFTASTLVVMKQSDIADKQQQEREEWRKGTGGIVKEVNPAAATVTISNALTSSGKPIVIHVSPTTIIRRYSPESVNFDEAKLGTLDQIKPGDQLRARGAESADGSEFTAQAIVSGTFKNMAGTVVATDASSGSVTVMDLVTKKPTTLKISAESQMHKLPPFVAQRFAARLKGGAPSADAGTGVASGEVSSNGKGGTANRGQGHGDQGNWRERSGQGPAESPTGGGENQRAGGSPDFQQMLSRLPSLAISDLKKGDAVMLVATEASPTSAPTAITLLSGVESILTAAPSGAAAATILSPWNLGSSPGGAASSE